MERISRRAALRRPPRLKNTPIDSRNGAFLSFRKVILRTSNDLSTLSFGGIGGAIGAFIYNLVAGWIGGLKVDIS